MLALLVMVPSEACSTGESHWAVFPEGGATPDTIIVVMMPTDPQDRYIPETLFTDSSGAPVPVARTWLPSTNDELSYELLIPEQPLTVGELYSYDYGGWGPETFVVQGGTARTADPPAFQHRELESGLDYEDLECVGTATMDTVHYSVCSRGERILTLVAEGETAPDPLGDFEGWAAGPDYLSLAGALDVSPGSSHRLWFASLDGAGRRSEWVGPEDFTMPADDWRELTLAVGEPPGCPPLGSWDTPLIEYCPQVDGEPLCGPPPEGGTDTTSRETTETTGTTGTTEPTTDTSETTGTASVTSPKTSCGCRSAGSGAGAWLLLLLSGYRRTKPRKGVHEPCTTHR